MYCLYSGICKWLDDNRILGNIVWETNRFACHSLVAKRNDPGSWNKLSLEELKAFIGLIVDMSIHRLPCFRDSWSSGWILGVPAFPKILTRDRFLAISNNILLCDNTQMTQSGGRDDHKLFKEIEVLENMKTQTSLSTLIVTVIKPLMRP